MKGWVKTSKWLITLIRIVLGASAIQNDHQCGDREEQPLPVRWSLTGDSVGRRFGNSCKQADTGSGNKSAQIVGFAGDVEMDDVVIRYRCDLRLRVASKTSEGLLVQVWKVA